MLVIYKCMCDFDVYILWYSTLFTIDRNIFNVLNEWTNKRLIYINWPSKCHLHHIIECDCVYFYQQQGVLNIYMCIYDVAPFDGRVLHVDIAHFLFAPYSLIHCFSMFLFVSLWDFIYVCVCKFVSIFNRTPYRWVHYLHWKGINACNLRSPTISVKIYSHEMK